MTTERLGEPDAGCDDVVDETVPRIVVGIDDSEQARRALRWGAYLGRRLGAVVEVVHAWELPVQYGMTPGMAQFTWDPHAVAEKDLVAVVDDVFGAHRPIGLRLVAIEGYPPKVLSDRSAGAALLVVGNRGRGSIAATLLGSVSASCAKLAHCAVLVVRDNEPPAGGGAASTGA